jgi:hypothetical protein
VTDVWPYFGNLGRILGRNSIDPKAFFVVAGVFPFQVGTPFATSKRAKTEDQQEQARFVPRLWFSPEWKLSIHV